MPIKATVAIDDALMIKARDFVRRRRVKSFNALVEKALREELEKMRAEELSAEIRAAAEDPGFLADIAEISADFAWVDHEGNNP